MAEINLPSAKTRRRVRHAEPSAPSPATVEFIYEHIKEGPERQIRDLSDLDGKLVQ